MIVILDTSVDFVITSSVEMLRTHPCVLETRKRGGKRDRQIDRRDRQGETEYVKPKKERKES